MKFTNREKLIAILSMRAGADLEDKTWLEKIIKYVDYKISDKENDEICDELQNLLLEMKEINQSLSEKLKKENLIKK